MRQNREELLKDFDDDIQKLDCYLKSQRAKWEAVGFHYETEEEKQTHTAYFCAQQEAERNRIAG